MDFLSKLNKKSFMFLLFNVKNIRIYVNNAIQALFCSIERKSIICYI